MFRDFLSPFFIFIIIFILFVTLFFGTSIPVVYNNLNFNISTSNSITFQINNSKFTWPTPGYSTITSPFGYRKAPTTGASTYHSGIDIAAPTGCNIVSLFSGYVTYTGFNGAGGYTITIKNDRFSASYCHVSPSFIVHVGQYIRQNEIIGKVGPKNVYGIYNNPYKDKNGNPTNGATTGPHLHLTVRKKGDLINPLDYF